MKWTREEYIELMIFGKFERQMFDKLFGSLIGLVDDWREQWCKILGFPPHYQW